MCKTVSQKKQESENFFKDAFCAEKAEHVFNKKLSDFNETGIIKITTSDGRGVFHVALLHEI